MICPKCGCEIPEGNMYCGKCGTEIQMVPDFVPELEIKIESTLDAVADDLNEEKVNIETADTIDLGVSFADVKPQPLPKSMLIIGAVALSILLLILAVMIYQDNSSSHQLKLGDRKYDEGLYNQACTYYKKAVELEPGSIDCREKLAECYMSMENPDMAVEVYKNMILIDPNSTLSYAKVISIYESTKEYDKIDDFLQHYANDDIREAFADYLALPPEFSHDSGEYDKAVILNISDVGKGTIYYTTDGSSVSEESEIYNAPIMLKKGNHIIQAMFKNDYGVCSSVVSMEYSILAESPFDPIVSLESGDYDAPQVIRVIVPDDCLVYYTTDGTVPNSLSYIYGEPIALPEGNNTYKFIAINSKGAASEVVECTYNLNVPCIFDKDQCLQILVNKLVDSGYLVDSSGTLANFPGKYNYIYSELRQINGISLYFYNEYYMTNNNSSKDMSGHIFGVDINSGNVYKVNKSANGLYSIAPMS